MAASRHLDRTTSDSWYSARRRSSGTRALSCYRALRAHTLDTPARSARCAAGRRDGILYLQHHQPVLPAASRTKKIWGGCLTCGVTHVHRSLAVRSRDRDPPPAQARRCGAGVHCAPGGPIC
eukprot:4265773-Prymnesium_polylepis.1